VQKCWAKTVLLREACFNFSSSNFHLEGHILNTSGVALRGIIASRLLGNPLRKLHSKSSVSSLFFFPNREIQNSKVKVILEVFNRQV